MEKQGETKNQHYVPRFILRKFSKDQRHISLLTLSNGKRIDGAKIAGQCKGDYFYGADQVMEKSFQAEESNVAKYLSDLAPTHLAALSEKTFSELRMFVHYQKARTRGAAMHMSRFVGAFAKTVLRDSIILNRDSEIQSEDLELVEIGLKNGQDESLWVAATSRPIMLDMAVKFIVADRPTGFVIADHPVVAYNQFAEHHSVLKHYPTSTGLAHKGLQLFMPLSPSVTLAIYDPGVYEYGGKSRVCRAGPQDVRFLNEMQAVNAWECIYFNGDRIDAVTLDALSQIRKAHPSRYQKEVSESDFIRRDDGTLSKFTVVTSVDIRVGAKLSFIRPTDGHSYEHYRGPSVPVRSNALLRLSEEYAKDLERIVAERRAAAGASQECESHEMKSNE